jgi:catecholate siderophore receptor
VGAAAFTAPACAQESAQGQSLGGVTVTDTVIEEPEIKVESAESPKYTRPLLDTPQTITVVSNTTLRQQNLLTLRDALSIIPGITFGAGEGGGGYGDSINLRGQSANNDIQIDGVRDSAQYSRSDTFNIEQLEVVNGANSVYGGSGSIGGSINLVTKRPKGDNLSIVSAGIGTDNYYRGTVDSNLRVSEKIAVRLNAMVHKNDVPGRDVEKYERWGVAPSVTLGIDSPTSLTLLYMHQQDDNTPRYGVPYYAVAGGKPEGVPYSAYYGYRNVDQQKQTVDQATAIFEHEINDSLSVRNLTRWQRVEQRLRVNPPQGTYCLASTGLTPTGGSCVVDLDTRAGAAEVFNITVPAGYYLPSGPRGNTRNSENQLMYNQLDFTANFTGGHTLVVGASYMIEDYDLTSGNSLREPDGSNYFAFDPAAPSATAHLPYMYIGNPNQIVVGPDLLGATYANNVYPRTINFVPTGLQNGETKNFAAYAFTTINLLEQLQLNGGMRWEHNSATFRSDTITNGAVTTVGANQKNVDDLFSYRVGAVYKPASNASLYIAYGNSRTPASSSVRGGCGTASVDQIALGLEPCTVAPERAVNYEIGGKIDLVGGKLQLTAALFRNERTNYAVASNDPAIGNLNVLDGRNRVDGVVLGAAGHITEDWSIFANYTYLKSKVRQSISDFCLENPGASYTPSGATTPITCPTTDVQAGNPLTNTPKHSGSLFTTYTFPFGLQVGYGLTYQGSFLLTNSSAAAIYKSDNWLTHRLFVGYSFDNGLSAQLNVQNLTDEKYYTGIRNNGWAMPGEGRSAVLSLSYSF